MHEGDGSVWEVCTKVEDVYKGAITRVNNSVVVTHQDHSGHGATPMIFPEPLPLCHGYGCVGLGGKRYIPVVHLLVTLYCVAIHASRLADDHSDADMHKLLLLM